VIGRHVSEIPFGLKSIQSGDGGSIFGEFISRYNKNSPKKQENEE
jgi:hypothetical protein